MQAREIAAASISGLVRCGYINSIHKLKVCTNHHKVQLFFLLSFIPPSQVFSFPSCFIESLCQAVSLQVAQEDENG